MMIVCIKREIDPTIRVLNKSTFKYFIASVMFYPISFAISKIMKLEYILNLKFIIIVSVIILACTIFYFIVLLLSKDEALSQLMDMILGKVRKKKKSNG